MVCQVGLSVRMKKESPSGEDGGLSREWRWRATRDSLRGGESALRAGNDGI